MTKNTMIKTKEREMEKNKYKVIAILDKKRIAINYGRNNQASKRDLVRVIEVGPEIIFEGKSYGTMDAIKAKLSIDTIYDNFSICTNSSIENDINSSILSTFTSNIRIYEDLDIDENQISNLKKPDITPISLGDIVEVYKYNWQFIKQAIQL